MDQANAQLIEWFPQLASNPLVFGVLKSVFGLDVDEAMTSRLPSLECYLGKTVDGEFIPHKDRSAADVAAPKTSIYQRRSNVVERSRERLRRAKRLVPRRRSGSARVARRGADQTTCS